jgi:hypothetical protein
LHVARKTACDFLLLRQKASHGNLSEDAQRLKALGAGRLTFDGGSHRHGEQTSSPYLQRVFTRFDEMDMLQFEALATQLYGPMLLTSNLSSTADVEEDA